MFAMGLRPGRCYSSIDHRPYTRVAITVHDKNYIGTVPAVRIRQFNMGNARRNYDYVVDLVSDEAMQVRDNAIEAARLMANRYLMEKLGKDNYFLRIRVFPHQILREHKQAQGAGADRVSQGMSHAFGKPIGRAVRLRKGSVIMSALAMEDQVEIVKEAFKRASSKLPCDIKIRVHKDIASIGTLPRKAVIEEEVEAAEKVEEAKAEETKTEEKKDEGNAT